MAYYWKNPDGATLTFVDGNTSRQLPVDAAPQLQGSGVIELDQGGMPPSAQLPPDAAGPMPPAPPAAPPMVGPPVMGGPVPAPGELAPPPPAAPPPVPEAPRQTINIPESAAPVITGKPPTGMQMLRAQAAGGTPAPEAAPEPGALTMEDVNRRQAEVGAMEEQSKLNEIQRKADTDARMVMIDKMRKDVEAYKIDPQYFWSGRPAGITVEEAKGGRRAAERRTTKEMAQLDLPDDPELRRQKLAANAVAKAREMRADATTQGTEGGMNMGQKIALIIASMVTSYASAKAGRDPMAGIQLIDKLQDQDMERQKLELGRRKDIMGHEVNILGQMRQMYQDDRAAEQAAKAMQIQQVKLDLDKMMYSADTQQKKDALMLQKQQLTQMAANQLADAESREANTKVSRYNAQTQRMGVLLQAGKEKEGKGPAAKQQDELAAINSGFEQIIRAEKMFTEANTGYGTGISGSAPDPGEPRSTTKYLGEREQMRAGIAKIYGPNPSDRDVKLVESQLPTEWTAGGTAKSKFDAMKRTAIDKYTAQIKSMDAAGMDTTEYRKILARMLSQSGGSQRDINKE